MQPHQKGVLALLEPTLIPHRTLVSHVHKIAPHASMVQDFVIRANQLTLFQMVYVNVLLFRLILKTNAWKWKRVQAASSIQATIRA